MTSNICRQGNGCSNFVAKNLLINHRHEKIQHYFNRVFVHVYYGFC